ncbi:RING/U-BOX SUPERFAMILY PROTEIN [Salix viminalis]|uniref:RING/U-BOX SUPERFAMILY PROTEIN n=1 Tax=Salix viminalis TaxID=40686 RepID=A0A9Q0Z7F2_SALVM|nr:RING/U-BOX SUPERFAMILY PROTEIN [Salix viminalis]
MEGQTTETGFLRGSGVGAVAGAVTSVQLLESMIDGEPLSKVALLHSLLNGKAFSEWVGPALLTAYQCQVTAILETTYREISDIYDTNGVSGLSEDCIQKLPEFIYQSDSNIVVQCCPEFCCSICLQDFKDWDSMRKLPFCEHYFHLECIDEWLTRNGSCPMCRNYVCSIDDDVL